MRNIAVIPGDGIGPEVIAEAVRVLERARETHDVALQLTHFDWGTEKFLRESVSLPEGALEMLAGEFYPFFSARDLTNLPNYHIYLKLMIDGVVSQTFSAETIPPR